MNFYMLVFNDGLVISDDGMDVSFKIIGMN